MGVVSLKNFGLMLGWATYVTIILACITLALALNAARLWRAASRSIVSNEILASADDMPELHILSAQVELNDLKAAAPINRQAAEWTGWAAVAGAVTSIWGSLAPVIQHLL